MAKAKGKADRENQRAENGRAEEIVGKGRPLSSGAGKLVRYTQTRRALLQTTFNGTARLRTNEYRRGVNAVTTVQKRLMMKRYTGHESIPGSHGEKKTILPPELWKALSFRGEGQDSTQWQFTGAEVTAKTVSRI